VIAYSHCGNDTACSYDTVLCITPPVASFTKTGIISIGTTYTGTTTGVDSIIWNFGDGATTSGTTASHTYTATGTYHICVTAYSPCGASTICKYDTVLCIAPPVASFTDTGTHTVGFVYTGSTAGMDSVVWTYGDGHTGTGTAITHTYSLSGTYDACVTVYTPCGIDSACDSITVVVPTTEVSIIHSSGNVQVFPNPANDELNVTGITESTQYRLLNVTGECVLQGTLQIGNNTISMQKIISGIYILEMTGEDGERDIVRVVKN